MGKSCTGSTDEELTETETTVHVKQAFLFPCLSVDSLGADIVRKTFGIRVWRILLQLYLQLIIIRVYIPVTIT